MEPPPSTTDCPILEFDPNPNAVLNPQHSIAPLPGMPERCVLCFFQEAIAELRDSGRATLLTNLVSENGPNPVYRLDTEGGAVALCHPGVGAPVSAFVLEELIALGCRVFVACGGGGVLDREIAVGHLVVPTSAVRDEGTSYHYLPPSREVAPTPAALAAVERVLAGRGVASRRAKAWTTDGLYRETPDKVRRRRGEGCAIVEMEAAALFAVARFRGVELAHILYGGDDVSGLGDWNHRDWLQHSIRTELVRLAAACALAVEV